MVDTNGQKLPEGIEAPLSELDRGRGRYSSRVSSHVLQGMEVYKGKLIAYSLGNFIFPGMDETKYGEDSCILSLGLYGGEVRYLEVYPVRLQATSVRLDPSSRIVERFYRLSEALR